jgi:hypothetical protein
LRSLSRSPFNRFMGVAGKFWRTALAYPSRNGHSGNVAGERRADGRYSRIRWEDPRRGPWGIQAMWVHINGRPECVGLTLWRGADQGDNSHDSYVPIPGQKLRPITATTVAELPIARIIDELRDAAREHWRTMYATAVSAVAKAGVELPSELLFPSTSFEEGEPRRPGAPRRYAGEHFEQVAEVYLAAWQAGRRPTQAVADAFGVSRTTAAKWISRARNSDLLTAGEQGKPGAAAGPALVKARRRRAKS